MWHYQISRAMRGLARHLSVMAVVTTVVGAQVAPGQYQLYVYYYDYFADIPGADFTKIALASAENCDVFAYEALNLANGRRTFSEIRDALAGLYAPVPLPAIAEYFDLLAKAGVVTLR